jgi:hypothetical protein
VTRESGSDRGPSLGTRGVHVQHAESHGQAAATVDDPHQIGVLQVIVGVAVARVAELARQGLGEDGAPAPGVDDVVGPRRHGARQIGEVPAVVIERNARPVEGSERQRGLGDVDAVVRLGAGGVEYRVDGRRAGKGGVGHPDVRAGSSERRTWLTTLTTPAMLRAWSVILSSSARVRAMPMM